MTKVNDEWWVAWRLDDKSVVAHAERARDVIVEVRRTLGADGPNLGVRLTKVKDARKDGVTI